MKVYKQKTAVQEGTITTTWLGAQKQIHVQGYLGGLVHDNLNFTVCRGATCEHTNDYVGAERYIPVTQVSR